MYTPFITTVCMVPCLAPLSHIQCSRYLVIVYPRVNQLIAAKVWQQVDGSVSVSAGESRGGVCTPDIHDIERPNSKPLRFTNFSIKEWVSFFLGSWGMNRSAGQTNRVNREAVLGRFVCSALRFIPHEPRKKDTHSLYLQCFQPRTLSKILREKL